MNDSIGAWTSKGVLSKWLVLWQILRTMVVFYYFLDNESMPLFTLDLRKKQCKLIIIKCVFGISFVEPKLRCCIKYLHYLYELTHSLPKAIKGFCTLCIFRWDSVSSEICIVFHSYIQFYQISFWTKDGVVQFPKWKYVEFGSERVKMTFCMVTIDKFVYGNFRWDFVRLFKTSFRTYMYDVIHYMGPNC